jgi:hypothetical protein
VEIMVYGLPYSRLPFVGRFLTKVFGTWLERRWGWYVVGRATK